MVNRSIENAQKKVEARNFDIRKHLLDYDDVMNKQRQAFYGRRREVLGREDLHEEALEMIEGVLVANLDAHWPEKGEPDAEELASLAAALEAQFGVPFPAAAEPFRGAARPARDREALGRALLERLIGFLEEKRKRCDAIAETNAELGYPALPRLRAQHPAADPRPPVEGPPALDGRAARGHQPARLRAARPEDRVPARGLRAVRGDAGAHRPAGGRGALQVRAARAAARRARRVRRPPRCARRPQRARRWRAPPARRRAALAVRRTARRDRRRGARPGARPPRASAATTRARAGAARSTRSAVARRSPRPGALVVPGFRAAGVALRHQEERRARSRAARERRPAAAAGVFTRSTVVGAPVAVSRRRDRAAAARAASS